VADFGDEAEPFWSETVFAPARMVAGIDPQNGNQRVPKNWTLPNLFDKVDLSFYEELLWNLPRN
jgi:hypothetical protein